MTTTTKTIKSRRRRLYDIGASALHHIHPFVKVHSHTIQYSQLLFRIMVDKRYKQGARPPAVLSDVAVIGILNRELIANMFVRKITERLLRRC